MIECSHLLLIDPNELVNCALYTVTKYCPRHFLEPFCTDKYLITYARDMHRNASASYTKYIIKMC
jgi:hypothetical protein